MQSGRGFSLIQWLVVLVVVLAVGVGAVALYANMRPKVVVTTLTRGPVVSAVYATGTVSPVREYPIRSKLEGTLEQVHVDKGDTVKAGQTLAIVADSSLTYAVERARAELVEKQARAEPETSPVLAEFDAKIRAYGEMLEIAKRDEARLRTLFEKQAGSSNDLDRAIDRVQTTWSTFESLKSQRDAKRLELQRDVAFAQSALKTAEWNLAEQNVESPIDGVVLDRPVSPGTRVPINEVLMRVADVTPSKLVMRAAVDEEDITRVRIGQRVIMTLYAFDEAKFEGRVKTIYAEADSNRRTFEVDIEILEPNERFQAGMTGELAFVLNEKADAAIVPAQALQEGHLYVVRNGIVERLTPKVGVQAVDRIEIIEGVPADAQVIISAITPDYAGRRVRVDFLDPRVAAGLNKTDDDKPFNPMR
jgi:HlyD family secretion protein